jgi:hypothetical protein
MTSSRFKASRTWTDVMSTTAQQPLVLCKMTASPADVHDAATCVELRDVREQLLASLQSFDDRDVCDVTRITQHVDRAHAALTNLKRELGRSGAQPVVSAVL